MGTQASVNAGYHESTPGVLKAIAIMVGPPIDRNTCMLAPLLNGTPWLEQHRSKCTLMLVKVMQCQQLTVALMHRGRVMVAPPQQC